MQSVLYHKHGDSFDSALIYRNIMHCPGAHGNDITLCITCHMTSLPGSPQGRTNSLQELCASYFLLWRRNGECNASSTSSSEGTALYCVHLEQGCSPQWLCANVPCPVVCPLQGEPSQEKEWGVLSCRCLLCDWDRAGGAVMCPP